MNTQSFKLNRFAAAIVIAILVILVLSITPSQTTQAAGPVNFISSRLLNTAGVEINVTRPTSLQFGPDGRLYVSQQNGTIWAYTIMRNAPDDYRATAIERISLINTIPNHNDDGSPAPTVNTRQITGILVVGTASNPVIFVSSSDSRHGLRNDTGLDTNSGVVSRLTWNGGTWDKVDLVRGLPRSEEFHSVNGMQLDPLTNILYLTVGGHANMGAPSATLSWLPEYAFSASILAIDLNTIGSTTYDMPTVDDPTRANNPDGSDVGDPFGGNDGMNQARVTLNSPVRLFSTGYRNPYDIVITQTGRMYTTDNGSNLGWGGPPQGEGTPNCLNRTVEDGAMTTPDQLHLVTDGFYAGNAAPVRGNPQGSGLWLYDPLTQDSSLLMNFTAGNTPLPFALARPEECDYREPIVEDGALAGWSYSTNGLTEYRASNFGGNMRGDLLAAAYNGTIQRIELNATGTATTNVSAVFANFGSTPLDVTAQNDNQIYPGTVWVALYGSNRISVFEPTDYDGGNGNVCSGVYDNALDEDGDSYTNADEIDNGTDECNASSMPPDNDGDHISDRNDNDDDNDGILDPVDRFAVDANNGLATTLPLYYSWNGGEPGFGLLDLGFTGSMINYNDDYIDLFNTANMTWGGAAGKITIDNVPAGSALTNTQAYGFQFGVNVTNATPPFTVRSALNGLFFNGSSPVGQQHQGIFIGSGDQDNYLYIALGENGIVVGGENNGVAYRTVYPQVYSGATEVQLMLSVDPVLSTVQPKYVVENGPLQLAGAPITIPVGSPLQMAMSDTPSLAMGILSSSIDGAPFTATWDFFEATPDTPSQLGASPAITDFGQVQVGETRTQEITLRNLGLPGDSPIQIDGLNLASGAFSMLNPPALPTTLNPGEMITVTVSFAPTAEGLINQTLNVNHTGANSPLQGSLNGVGLTLASALYRVNAGGPEVAAIDGGIPWSRDEGNDVNRSPYVNQGLPLSNTQPITNTLGVPQAIFATERSDPTNAPNMIWSFPIAQPGLYEVRLYFAETSFTGSGERVFSVLVENAVVNNNYDIFAQAGGANIAARLSHVANVTDGMMNIEFLHIAQNPTLMAIEILPLSGVIPAGVLSITPDLIDFNATPIGIPSHQTVLLNHTGAMGSPNITISRIAIGGVDASEFSTPALLQPIVLTPGSTHTVPISFIPTTAGAKTATLQVNHDGANAPQVTGNLTGLATTGSTQLLVSPSPVSFGQIPVNGTQEQTITLHNVGIAGSPDLTITDIALGGANADQFSIIPFAQNIILPAGQMYQFALTFAPTNVGIQSATLEISHDGNNAPLTIITLEGEGVASNLATLTSTPLVVDYGNVSMGDTSQQAIILTHSGASGTAPITVTGLTLAGLDVADFQINPANLPLTLQAGQTYPLDVILLPLTPGNKSAQLEITHNGLNGPATLINLTGNVTVAPTTGLAITPNPVTFPDTIAGDTSVQQITLANNDAVDLVINTITVDGGIFTTNAVYPLIIPVGTQVTIDISFAPTAVGGQNATLTIDHTGTNGPETTVNLIGIGLMPPVALEVNPDPIDFGQTIVDGINNSAVVTLNNTSNEDLTVDAVAIEGTNADQFEIPALALPLVIPAGDIYQFNIDFLANIPGLYTAELIISHDNGSGLSGLVVNTVNITGETLVHGLEITPISLDFGDVVVGSDVAVEALILTYNGFSGDPAITVTDIMMTGTDSSDFTSDFAQAIVLNPGESYSFLVTYNPLRIGTVNAILEISHDAPNGPLSTVDLRGTGIQAEVASTGIPAVVDGSQYLEITKSAHPPFARPGDTVSWTIEVYNANTTTITDVTVTDTIPDALDLISVVTSTGIVATNNQQVTVSQIQIEPRQTVIIRIETRIRLEASEAYIIRNEACIEARCASGQVIRINQLPATGDSPWSKWRLWAGIVMCVVFLSALAKSILWMNPTSWSQSK